MDLNFLKVTFRVVLWVITIAVYAAILLVTAYMAPHMYAGPPHPRDIYDNLMFTVPLVHIVLVCLAFVNFKFQKLIITINLGVYLLLLAFLIGYFMVDSPNVLVIGVFLIWIRLFVWSVGKWISLRKKELA